MYNRIVIVGHLGGDPEVRTLPSNQAVATFSVATNRKFKTRDGDRREETEWFSVETWGRTAEVCAQYLQKGALVLVEGRIKTDSWEDRETGAKRYKTKLVAETVRFLGGTGDRSSTETTLDKYPEDDDIPF